MNNQNLSFFRNGFTQGWTTQRLESVGATLTAATEAFALPIPSPRLRVSGKIFTYLRLMEEKCLRGRGVIKAVDRAKSTSGTIAVKPSSTASQNFERNDH